MTVWTSLVEKTRHYSTCDDRHFLQPSSHLVVVNTGGAACEGSAVTE